MLPFSDWIFGCAKNPTGISEGCIWANWILSHTARIYNWDIFDILTSRLKHEGIEGRRLFTCVLKIITSPKHNMHAFLWNQEIFWWLLMVVDYCVQGALKPWGNSWGSKVTSSGDLQPPSAYPSLLKDLPVEHWHLKVYLDCLRGYRAKKNIGCLFKIG